MSRYRGDAVVALVVILAIGLLGVVGWVAYDTFVAKSADESPETSQVAMKEACATHEKLCFEYPDTWSLDLGEREYPGRESDAAQDLEEDEYTVLDLVRLTAPSGKVTITLTSGISGIGGMCDPETEGRAYVVQRQATQLKGYDTEPADVEAADAYAVSLVASNQAETEFWPMIGLTRMKELIDESASTACNTMYFGIVPGKNIELMGDASFHGGTQFATGNGLGEEYSPEVYSTLEEAKKALESTEYSQALGIIASAHY